MKSASDLLIATIRHIVVALGCLFVSPLPLPGQGALGAESGKDESVRSLGVYVTRVRLSQVTETGLMAIPQGALVSVVESAGGQKYAVFRQARVMIADLSMVSNDPSRIAAATAGAAKGAGNLTPGSVIGSGGENGPQARTQRQILVDDDGNVIAKSMTTTIDDGAGNTTTIEQGNARGMTPERAGKLAAAQQKIIQQKNAISDLKTRRLNKGIVSGYESKLREMTDLLTRMEVEYARMQAEYSR